MDGSLRSRAEQLASEIASQAKTAEVLNGLMRLMMKSALERMLNSEVDVHLGRRAVVGTAEAEQPSAGSPTATEPPVPRASVAKRSFNDAVIAFRRGYRVEKASSAGSLTDPQIPLPSSTKASLAAPAVNGSSPPANRTARCTNASRREQRVCNSGTDSSPAYRLTASKQSVEAINRAQIAVRFSDANQLGQRSQLDQGDRGLQPRVVRESPAGPARFRRRARFALPSLRSQGASVHGISARLRPVCRGAVSGHYRKIPPSVSQYAGLGHRRHGALGRL
jgi:hypothetical protein